jgi:ornithine cyclodeaminase
LGPTSPKISPVETSNDTPSTATVPPYVLWSPSTWTTGEIDATRPILAQSAWRRIRTTPKTRALPPGPRRNDHVRVGRQVTGKRVTEIGRVLAGDAEGRRSASDITLFDSTGLPIQYLAIAKVAAAKAYQLDIARLAF